MDLFYCNLVTCACVECWMSIVYSDAIRSLNLPVFISYCDHSNICFELYVIGFTTPLFL
uniref:Uncharacterized protein n=1 Tax=Arundo donax TaxID=35708 RepID=A0A0A8ZVN3_ARUDO